MYAQQVLGIPGNIFLAGMFLLSAVGGGLIVFALTYGKLQSGNDARRERDRLISQNETMQRNIDHLRPTMQAIDVLPKVAWLILTLWEEDDLEFTWTLKPELDPYGKLTSCVLELLGNLAPVCKVYISPTEDHSGPQVVHVTPVSGDEFTLRVQDVRMAHDLGHIEDHVAEPLEAMLQLFGTH